MADFKISKISKMWGPFRPGPPANPRPPIEIGVFAVDLFLQVDYAIVSHGLGPQRAGVKAISQIRSEQGSAGKIQSDSHRTECKASPNTTASGSRVRTAELESLRLIRERSGPSASARAASDPLCRLVGTNLTAALRRYADYTAKWIVSRWRTQRSNRRRSVNECNGDVTTVSSTEPCPYGVICRIVPHALPQESTTEVPKGHRPSL